MAVHEATVLMASSDSTRAYYRDMNPYKLVYEWQKYVFSGRIT